MEASSLSLSRPSRAERVRASMSSSEWRRAGGMAAVIAGLHGVGFGLLILLVLPQHFRLGAAGTFAIGTGITAYTLGMRHAFDADHIAAIDNTTRKMMSEGKRPLSVGFFFSLGHSTIVFGLAFLLAIGVRALSGPVQDDGSMLHKATNVIGTTISGLFLYIIAILNILILVSIVRIFLDMRRGAYNEQQLDQQLNSRGLMNRFLGRHMNKIREPWQMYPLGVLFGLGFDTATEVGLLAVSAGVATKHVPFLAVLSLPILFAAGMSLMDTADGAFMSQAYGWAFSNPVRKVYYNITITTLSVGVALVVGTIELLQVVGQFQGLDFGHIGYGIVAAFVLTWALSVGVWKKARIEERWGRRVDAR